MLYSHTNSDKSPPNGFSFEADGCPKTENSDSDNSPFRTTVRLPLLNCCKPKEDDF